VTGEDLDSDVRHNLARHRYELDADGGTAVAEYYERDGARIFTHTEVPRRSEGRGVGSKLVRAALEDTKRAGLKIVPACSFVVAFVARHPEYRTS
jgi:predicted GNAT family acetyltransferase